LFKRAEPPARILASRRSLRMRACSDALDGAEVASDEGGGGVSGIVSRIGVVKVEECKDSSWLG
jgi:hypothetical protein